MATNAEKSVKSLNRTSAKAGSKVSAFPRKHLYVIAATIFTLALLSGCGVPRRFYACSAVLPDSKAAVPVMPSEDRVCTQNLEGSSAGSTVFAQSFVPHCGKIGAIEVATYPIQTVTGWLRLELHEANGNQPGR